MLRRLLIRQTEVGRNNQSEESDVVQAEQVQSKQIQTSNTDHGAL